MKFVGSTKPHRKSGGMGHPVFRGATSRAQHNVAVPHLEGQPHGELEGSGTPGAEEAGRRGRRGIKVRLHRLRRLSLLCGLIRAYLFH
jgi:hypothetical protein